MTISWAVEPHAATASFLNANHYLGAMKSGARVCICGRVSGDLVACMIWRAPTNRHLPSDGSWLELSRWCLTPQAGLNAGSRMHKAAVRLVRVSHPAVTTLVSYSDPGQGHTGSLYRACNWLWAPTWHRLRPPPTGNGTWGSDKTQNVKDRWVFPLRPDPARADRLAVKDNGAIAFWSRNADPSQIRLALSSPAPDMRAAAEARAQQMEIPA